MPEPMTSYEAAEYAPQWGSYMTSGDPGACMYGLDDKGRPEDAEARDAMIEHIDDHCLPIARERIESGEADEDESEDVEKLEALKAYLNGLRFPTEPDEPHAMAEPHYVGGVNLIHFADYYVKAMLWSSTDESDESGGVPMDDIYGPENLAPRTWQAVEADCRAFLEANGSLITEDNFTGKGSYVENAGHDFWLTRAGHGCGFWDGDWKSDKRQGLEGPLTVAAKGFGNLDPYVGDDGMIYTM